MKGEKKIIKDSLFYQCFILLISLVIITPNIFLIFTVKAGFSQKNNIIKRTIYFKSPTLVNIEMNNSIFTQIIMSNCFLEANPGDPAIPYYPISFLIPEGKKLQTISVSYSKYIEIYHDLIEKPLMPQQECKPLNLDERKISFIINESCYNSTEPVLKQIYQVGDIGYCRCYPLITIFLYPVQYYPKIGRLFYYPSMTVTLAFSDNPSLASKSSRALLRNTASDRKIISTLVQNSEEIFSYYEDDEQFLSGG